MLRTIIVDDEADAIEFLEAVIKDFCPEIEVIDTGRNALQGIKLINTHKPDLVFLDVEMPNGSGFDILEAIPDRTFHVIFITAYNNYAVNAFKVNAVDYLLKPLDINDLINAVKKAKELISAGCFLQNNYNSLLKTVNPPKQKISLPTSKGVEFINIEDIAYIEADGNNSTFYLQDKSTRYVAKPLKEFEETLDSHIFYRSHKTQIINLSHVIAFNSKEGGYIELSGGVMAPISRKKKDEFLDLMQKFSN